MMYLLLALFTAGYASAEQLFFSEMPVSIPGNYSLYSFDTVTGDVKKITTGYEEAYTAYDFVSGAASCGSRYYSSAVQAMISWGLEVVDTTTGEAKIFSYQELKSDRIFHNIYCSGTDDHSLITVQSTTTGEFSLWSVDVAGSGPDDWKITQTKIGDFDSSYYVGSDTIFASTFSQTNEIYASFANEKYTSGSFQIMDMSGQTQTYDIAGFPGYPYASVPLSKNAMEFIGVVNDQGVAKRGKFSVSGDTASFSDAQDAQDLYTGSQPWQYSPRTNQIYATTSTSNKVQKLLVLDAETLEVKESYLYQELIGGRGDMGHVGGLAVNMDL